MAEKKRGEPQEVEARPVASGEDRRERHEAEKTRDETFVTPDVDIYEEDDSLVLLADVPGVEARGLEAKLENDVLEITAHRTEEKGADEPDYAEYRPASYYRAFSLSEDIDAENISASVKDGILTVTLPKSARARPRKIEVKAG